MSSDSSWTLLRLEVPAHLVELVIDDLLMRGAAAVEEIEASDDDSRIGNGSVVLRTSLGVDVSDATGTQMLHEMSSRFPDVIIATEDVPRSVADTWREHARAVRVDDSLWLCPAWVPPPEGDASYVVVEPFDTFGLGNHPTTVGALRLARRYVSPGARLHDHGTGSGVIAVAMTSTHGCRVSADDIHPGSRGALEHNAVVNGIAVPEWTIGLPQNDVDAVVANILAPVLRQEASAIVRRVRRGGVVVLAGMRADQVDGVVECYESCHVIETEMIDGWVAVALRVG